MHVRDFLSFGYSKGQSIYIVPNFICFQAMKLLIYDW